MTPMRRGTWACGGVGRRKESFGSQEKAATRNGRLGCGFEDSLARAFETSSPCGGRADLVAQPQTANAIRTAPKPKPFSFGGILVKLQQTRARCLFWPLLASVWQRCCRRGLATRVAVWKAMRGQSSTALSHGSRRLRIRRKVCEHERDCRKRTSGHRCRP